MKNKLALPLALALAVPVLAQNTRSWVSSTGDDNNMCTRASPCATMNGALSKTNDGGEIDVVDPGDYGSASISQAVTIDGGGMARLTGVHIFFSSNTVVVRNLSILASIGDAIDVQETFSAAVLIDHVRMTGSGGGSTGVWLDNRGNVTVTDSSISGFAMGVLTTSSSATLTVRNTAITQSSQYGVETTGGVITLDSCSVSDGAIGVQAGNPLGVNGTGTVRLTNTTITNNTTGLALGLGQANAIVSFVNNRIYGNGTNGSPTLSVFQK
jgi:Right handed beta helix region